MDYFKFSLIIKEKRINKRLTQKEIASMLLISKSRYNRIENGKSEPSFNELILLCKILDIDFSKETKENEVSFRPHYD